MNNSAEHIQMMEGLLEKYGFTAPLTKDVKKFERISSKRVLKGILKKAGVYNIVLGIYLYCYYIMKKFGINYLGFKIIITLLFISFSTSSYLLFKYFNNKEKINPIPIKMERIIQKENKIIRPTYKVGLRPFSTSTPHIIDKKILNKVSAQYINEIKNLKGKNFIKIIDNSEIKNSKQIFVGYIDGSSNGNDIMICMKIMDTVTSKIEDFIIVSGKIDQIDELCAKSVKEVITFYDKIK